MARVVALLVLIGGVAAGQAGCGGAPPRDAPEPRTTNQTAQTNTQLAIGYIREGQYERAFNKLQRALKADPDYPLAHNAMAVLYGRLNEPHKAEAHYRRALHLDPSDSQAHNNYGQFLCREGRYEEAEHQFHEAVENHLYDAPQAAYTNAGLCMQRAGRLDQAEKYLRQALQVDPKFPYALLSMAEISYKRGHPLSARGYLQRYAEVGPKTPGSLWLGIRIERTLGDRSAADSYAMLLKANYPDSREAQLLQESEAQ
jgi:type IV pilus assembly protein PilF